MMSLEQQLFLAQSALQRDWVRPDDLRQALRAWDDDSLGRFLNYHLAALAAVCAASVMRDVAVPLPRREKLAEEDVRRSLRRLRQAEAGGYFKSQANREEFAKEPDFAFLRAREVFKEFVKGLGGSGA